MKDKEMDYCHVMWDTFGLENSK